MSFDTIGRPEASLAMQASALDRIDVVLFRPQLSDNVGAVARAMKNFGLKRLVLVAPRHYDVARARALAVSSEDILESARLVDTLEEAIAGYSLVIPTTERAMSGREPPVTPPEAANLLLAAARTHPDAHAALLFGEESTGLSNAVLSRHAVYSTIPASPEKRSLNLAQAALLYAWELHQASGGTSMPERPGHIVPGLEPAPHALLDRLRERVKRLGVATGFLHPQAPDRALDELMRLLQRAQPNRREVELLLAGVDQLERTSTVLSD